MNVSERGSDPEKSLVGFTVGSVTYAVPIRCVREIINPLPITRLPHAPAVVVGVADHRGDVVPIIDMRIRFGVQQLEDARRNKWILIDVDGTAVGLAVDRVTEVFGISGGGLRAAPSLGGGEDERGIVGVTSHNDDMVFVLDLACLGRLATSLGRETKADCMVAQQR